MVFDIGNYTSNANKVINDTNRLKGVMAAGAAGGLAMAASLKAIEIAGRGVSAVLRGIANEVRHGFGVAMMTESAETRFRVLLKSAEKAKALMKDVRSFTLATPFSMEGTLGGTKQLMGAGVPEKRLMPTMRMLGELSGGNTETFGLLAHTYGEVMSKGRVLASEMNQVSAAGINMRDALAKEAGVSVTDLAKKIESGTVTAENFHNALHSLATGKFKGGLQEAGKDLQGIINRLSEVRDQFSGSLMTGLADKMGLKDLGKDFADLAEGLSSVVAPKMVDSFGMIADAAFDLVDNLRGINMVDQHFRQAMLNPLHSISVDRMISDLANINTKRDVMNARTVLRTAAGAAGGNGELPKSQRLSTLTWDKIGSGLSKLFGSIGSGGDTGAAWRMSLGSILGGTGAAFGRVGDRFALGGKAEERKPTGALVAGSSEAFSAIIRSMFQNDKKKEELAELKAITKGVDKAKDAIVEAIKGQITGVLGALSG
jgi:tape measure domain-containing protein